MKRTAAGLLAAAAWVSAELPWAVPFAAAASTALAASTAGSGRIAASAPRAPGEPLRPGWVDRFPHDPDRYIGIGRVDKRSHPGDFRELALAQALAQISREISVDIAAANSATRTENAGGAEETYAGHVAATTRNLLAGYTLDAVYETDGEFWACYALDKETWERAQADKARGLAAAMDRGLAGIEADVDARRIQAAGGRLARLHKEFAAALAADPGLRDRSGASADRLAAQSAKLEAALQAARLTLSPDPWIFPLPASAFVGALGISDAASKTPGAEARVVLRDPDSDRPWLGPLSLRISEWPARVASECRVETDATGGLDLAIPFQACGLASGIWRVAWTGPGSALESREFHAKVAAEWRPVDVVLAILQEPIRRDPAGPGLVPEPRTALPELRDALESWRSRRYRIAAGSASLPVIEVRIREVTLDSLEGMCFASVRASLSFPGRPGSVEARGKAGHADRGRALRRAAADFAREAALAADQSAAGTAAGRVNLIPLR
ncbi:MAG: LPP20 family lipoprotein [Fibrobacteria bacterium]